MTDSGQPLSIGERLAIVYQRLDALPPASGPEEAYRNLADTMNVVEDEHSGVPFDPNAGLAYDGRMYPPRADYISREADGTLVALTKGHRIVAAPDGTLTIANRRDGREVYKRQGAG